jgi:FkbM family methyltransferase
LLIRLWNRPRRAERRVLRRLVGARGAAVLAGRGAEAWATAVRRRHPLAALHFPDAADLAALDRYCAARGLRHIDFLRCGAGELGAVLAGAERLLHHSRIGVFSVDSPISPDLVQALEDHRYRLVSRTLALHERLLPLIERGPKSMLDLAALCRRHGIAPRGIVHVGAHEGREFETYRGMGAHDMLFIEANPAVFARLAANLAAAPGVVLANCAIAAQSGPVMLHVTSSDQSSSILPLGRHRDYYPSIVETEAIIVEGKTVDALLAELRLAPERFNILNIDIQGAEIEALRGAADLLPHIAAINLEVNFEELYKGCAQVDELDDFLAVQGFRRVATTCPHHMSWGDGFYVRPAMR